ncbi:MAG: hypothetical protein NVSMB9_31970 [Isosphaeraceae bacterium]
MSVMRPFGHAAQIQRFPQAPISELKGHIVGLRAPAGLSTPNLPGFVGYSGHGRANAVGNVYLGTQHMEIPSNTSFLPSSLPIANGTAVLTTFRGEQINLYYEGSATTYRGRNSIALQGSVLSGTGQFENAQGFFSATGSVSRSGRFTLDFVITFDRFPVI